MVLMSDLFRILMGLKIFLTFVVLPGSSESTNTISNNSNRAINQFVQPGPRKEAKGEMCNK